MKHILLFENYTRLDEIKALPKSLKERKLFNTKEEMKEYEEMKKSDPDQKGYLSMLLARANIKVGDKHVVDYSGGPFFGRETFEVTRIEANGDVYGKSIEGGAMELDPEDTI
jgi:hypothetical protein